jgi:peptidoglycan/LPS O-acetylase OafA/YrhL
VFQTPAGTFALVKVRDGHFPLFDSVRGLAALMVFVVHASALSGVIRGDSAAAGLVARLDIAVPIFLVISGFLLYRPFAAAHLRDQPMPSVGAYAWRRFLRVVPAYWVALTLLTIALSLATFSSGRPLVYYGFLQLYDRGTTGGGIGQAWTICVEVTFYASLPFVAAGARRLRARGAARAEVWMVGGLALLSVAYNVVLVATGAAGDLTYAPVPLLVALPGTFCFFAIGMLMGVASVELRGRAPEEQPRLVRFIDRAPGLVWLLTLASLLVVATFGPPPFGTYSQWDWIGRNVLYALAAAAFVAPAIFGDPARGWVRRLLASRATLYLGLVSYGFYLWHYGVLLQMGRWGWADHSRLSPVLFWLIALAATVALASLSYYLVERPALSLKRLVPGRRSSREAMAEPAPVAPP